MQAHLAALADVSAESSVRREAALTIGALRHEVTPEEVAQVLTLLSSPHDCEVGGSAISVRRAALLAFTELARGADGAVPAAVQSGVKLSTPEAPGGLVGLICNGNDTTREMAVRAMAVLGEHADAHSVVQRLQDTEEDVRSAAGDALVVLRDVLAPDIIEQIAQCLPTGTAEARDDEDEVRALVLQTLAGIAAAPGWYGNLTLSSLAVVVAPCLADDAPATRAAALAALAAFGPQASAAHVDNAAALFEDEQASVRLAAIEALAPRPGMRGLGSAERHGEALSELLVDCDRSVRGAATAALKQWGLA